MPGLWFDLDLAYGQHAASALPATDAEALDFLSPLPTQPSLIIHSGGGMYGYWLFREPHIIATEAERETIAHLSEQFTHTLVMAGKQRGWTLDALGDLARVLRPPGTLNHKYGKPVKVLHESATRYNPSDFDWLLDLPTPARATHAGAAIAGQPGLVVISEHYGTALERKSQTELAGPHPQHGSSTGDNFNVNLSKGLWKCWRRGTGGDALALVAVCEGLLACEDARSGALRGEVFKQVVTIANEMFQAGISLGTPRHVSGSMPATRGTEDPDLPPEPVWPQCAPEAFAGLAGEIVKTIAPETESDPVAILGQLLVMVGNAIGRTPYFPVEATRHYPTMFLCLVGATSRGRKGTSAAYPKRLLREIDPDHARRVKSSLSSGEGVIWNVRDPTYGRDKKGAARLLWHEIYTALAEGAPGLVGALTARAEAQVLRLSMLYALCDQSAVIEVSHLEAAYALWQYCEASARYVFGESLGDPLADSMLQMLRYAGSAGLTRTDINNELGRNVKSAAIGQALALLRRDYPALRPSAWPGSVFWARGDLDGQSQRRRADRDPRTRPDHPL